MGHDATKVLLGTTESTFKNVDSRAGDIAAGLAVVLEDDDTVSSILANGNLLGVSLGKDLSGTDRFCAICRNGSKVPIQVDSITPTIGAQVQLHATSGKGVASGTAVNATYVSGLLTGINEAGEEVDCALIDMQGGL